jgi:glycosyl transferase family 87
VVTSVLLGQIGAVLTLLITAAWLADRDDRLMRAGVLMGAAIGVKPFLAVFGAYALWRRSRSMLAGLSLGFAATLLVSLLAAGVSGFQSWVGALGKISWSAHVVNGSLQGLFTRIFAINDPVLHATPLVVRPHWVQPVWWASVAIVVVLGARALVLTRSRDIAWSLVLVGSLLISPLGWEYYGTIFAGPLIAAALAARRPAQILIAAGYVCMLTPPITVPLGVVGILLFGSIYTWGFLLIYAGVVIARGEDDVAGSL